MDGTAKTRMMRAIAGVLGAAAIVFGALVLPGVLAQAPDMLPWWSAVTLAMVLGLPVVMALLARWSSAGALRLGASAIAVAQAFALVTWLPAMRVAELPPSASSPWTLGVAAIGTTAAALAWPVWCWWPYLLGTGLFIGVDRALSAHVPAAVPYQDALYAVTFCAVLAALVSACIASGAALDRAAASAQQTAAAEAAHRVEIHQRARLNALLHDQVLATLLVASEGRRDLHAVIADQARSTLRRINEFATAETVAAELPAHDFIWRMQAIATDIDPIADFTYEISDDAATVNTEAAAALGESLSEALRNILKHAEAPGRDLHRAVHVDVTASGVILNILDDGRGFDPGAVAPARLGIAVSIRERMTQLAGGRAAIVSVVGQGTRVQLEWERS